MRNYEILLNGVAYQIETGKDKLFGMWITRIKRGTTIPIELEALGRVDALGDTHHESLDCFFMEASVHGYECKMR